MNNELKEFYTTQNSDKIIYYAFIISSDSMGEFRFVKNQTEDITFNVDSTPKIFSGISAELPEESMLSSDDTDKGEISFDRIGYDVITELRKLDNAPKFEAVNVRILQYIEGDLDPQSDYSVFMGNFSASEREVTLTLTTQNLNKQAKGNKTYEPNIYVGLKGI